MKPGQRSYQSGYSLLEVIVAFGVLALALTLLLGTLSGGLRQVRQSVDAGRAALYAQSLLDTLGVDVPLQPGRTQGEFEQGRYQWQLNVAPYLDPVSGDLAVTINDNQAQLLELQLEVFWGSGEARQRWQVHSVRLVPQP